MWKGSKIITLSQRAMIAYVSYLIEYVMLKHIQMYTCDSVNWIYIRMQRNLIQSYVCTHVKFPCDFLLLSHDMHWTNINWVNWNFISKYENTSEKSMCVKCCIYMFFSINFAFCANFLKFKSRYGINFSRGQ
jgi:hypothetical protein